MAVARTLHTGVKVAWDAGECRSLISNLWLNATPTSDILKDARERQGERTSRLKSPQNLKVKATAADAEALIQQCYRLADR